MVILDPYGMTFDAVGVFDLAFSLSFKYSSSYCEVDLKNIFKYWKDFYWYFFILKTNCDIYQWLQDFKFSKKTTQI